MVSNLDETQLTAEQAEANAATAATPGIVLVHSLDRPRLVPRRLEGRGATVIGRDDFANALHGDDRVSRRHVEIRVVDDGFEVADAGSRNGTFLDGERVHGTKRAGDGAVLRFGKCLAILVADLRPFDPPRSPEEADAIVGPRLRRAWSALQQVAQSSDHVLILGESGSGKELAAAAFHEATKRSGPFIAVNCSAIPVGIAERLLFGARRGAYSGADKEANGYLQSADGGTLFLDEIAELDLEVQAKLLRAIESSEILPLGASHPVKVSVRICAATHTDLRTLVARGGFREDLFFRIGRPDVRLPPLRERKEEIPWLIARELASMRPRVDFVEACLIRQWPGNIRELRSEVRQAMARARQEGREEITVSDLDEVAGTALDPQGAPELVVRHRSAAPEDERIRQALADAKGNVTAAARALGIHRTQLRRWVERHET